MKRLLYYLLPHSFVKKLKLMYYNTINSKFSFLLYKNLYITKEANSWEVITKKPLYFIVKDINRYEKYYKIKLNDIIIDAGANEGLLSVVYSKKTGVKGKVFCFEPDSINIQTLKSNVFLNKGCDNIHIHENALWNKEKVMEFFEAGTVGSSIFYEGENSRKVIIQATSIDNFININNLKQLNFVKMDIEGAEIQALEGAINSINKFRPDFAIASYHIINNKPTYIAIEAFFKKIGYPYKTDFFNDGEIMTYAGDSVIK